ncbi:MAG: NAD-dependent epimerase/dehydratase family protein [Chloroflexi bacterium]|nr:NAD-dependent epimerase/dehydratase family protein [Chloroflexota bacterium]
MKVLITGGAGFIGCNWAARLLRGGHEVTVFDNLSRKGAAANLEWLRAQRAQKSQGKLHFVRGDVRDAAAMAEAAKGQKAIYHLAAQVAVTTSVTDPREDFEINALGTFNVLEAARAAGTQPMVAYASTNKVYGGMEEVRVAEEATRWRYADLLMGLPETQPLDFHSPYGCSKGAGDQYARDYARIYDLPTVVFRQSCIYGLRQFGVEDQGWLAHFVIATAKGRAINIYGDGKQVRDMLWVDDLLDAYEIALNHPEKIAGRIYNIGGGPDFTLSIWTEVGPILESLAGRKIEVRYGDWRPGDQKVYISDIRKAEAELGWKPMVSPPEGVKRLWEWVSANASLFD